MQFCWEDFGLVGVEPVGVWETCADFGDGFADGSLGVCEVWVAGLEELGGFGVSITGSVKLVARRLASGGAEDERRASSKCQSP